MSDKLHRSIEALGTELVRHIDPSHNVEPPIYAQLGSADTEEACHQIFRHANAVARSPSRHDELPPLFTLTKTMLAMAEEQLRLSSEGTSVNGSCFQAELRIVRALARHARGAASADRLPSAALLDQDREPVCISKCGRIPDRLCLAIRILHNQSRN
jgi:hypothetical protein